MIKRSNKRYELAAAFSRLPKLLSEMPRSLSKTIKEQTRIS